MCIDAKTERRLALVGAQMDQSQCSAYRMSRGPGGAWLFHSVCRIDTGSEVTTDGTATGDFSSAYFVRATGSTTGAARPEMNATHSITIDAKWLGACPAGQAGGDVTSGGRTLNVFAPTSR